MSDNFTKYETLRVAGSSAEEVYQTVQREGIDPITRIRLIRAVFSVSLGQAKEVIVRAEGRAPSLDKHQESIADALM